MRHLFLIAFVLIVIVGGCEASRSPTTPSPPPVSSMVFTGVSPPSGSTILLPMEYPYILPGGKSSEFCGDNGPDAPTWSFLTTGWTTTYSVTGFRVYRLPCEVTGIRAMLHMRNNGLNIPPTPTETIAEATLPVSYLIDRVTESQTGSGLPTGASPSLARESGN